MMELPVRWGSKLEVPAVVCFFAVQGEKLVEIYRLICETYGDEFWDSSRNLPKWFKNFSDTQIIFLK